MSDKHGPNSWEDYLAVHESRLDDFREHFILEDRLTHVRTASTVQWDGSLLCAGGMEIHVRKRQAVTLRAGRPWVQTVDYSYQVLLRDGAKAVQLFRYDNSAHHDHPDPHHLHRYDANGLEIRPVEHVGADGWPTLGEVIEQAHERWRSS